MVTTITIPALMLTGWIALGPPCIGKNDVNSDRSVVTGQVATTIQNEDPTDTLRFNFECETMGVVSDIDCVGDESPKCRNSPLLEDG